MKTQVLATRASADDAFSLSPAPSEATPAAHAAGWINGAITSDGCRAVIGPSGRWRDFRRAIVDSGADDTLFPADAANLIGASLMPGLGHSVLWRGTSYPLRFGRVELELSSSGIVYRWPAIVGFCSAPLPYPLLGSTGFLQYFNATFHGADQVLELDPIVSFPGLTKSVS